MTARRVPVCIALLLITLSAATACTAAQATGAGSYQIQPGDQLRIDVWHEEDLQREIMVRPDGGISFPLVGDLVVKGLTPVELTTLITKSLARFIPEPEVTVTVLQATGNRLYVIGEVNKPGEFAMARPVNVLQALAMAGGLTPYAERKDIRVLRGSGEQQQALSFNYTDVAGGRGLKQNIELQPGDVVLVP